MIDERQQLNEHLAERVDEKMTVVERPNSLRPFVSPQLAEALAASPHSSVTVAASRRSQRLQNPKR